MRLTINRSQAVFRYEGHYKEVNFILRVVGPRAGYQQMSDSVIFNLSEFLPRLTTKHFWNLITLYVQQCHTMNTGATV